MKMHTGIVVFFCLAANVFAQDRPNSAAQIQSVTGKPQVRVINLKTSDQRLAERGASLDEGDKIVTENGQAVVLQMAEGTEVSVGPSTSFQIDTFSKEGPQQSIFSMAYGMIRALVTKSYGEDETFAVRTKNAVMGVRGTEFVLQSDAISNETQVHTFSGTVRFAQATNDLSRLRTAMAVPAGSMSRLGRGMAAPVPAQKFNVQKFRVFLKTRSPSLERRVRAFHPELNRIQSMRRGTRVPHIHSPSGKDKAQRRVLERKRAQVSERRKRWERRNARFEGMRKQKKFGNKIPGMMPPVGMQPGGMTNTGGLPPPPPPPGSGPGSGSTTTNSGSQPPPPPPPPPGPGPGPGP